MSSWKFDKDGRAYVEDEAGRCIYVSPPKSNEHLSTTGIGKHKNTGIPQGHYRPFPDAPASWPPRDQSSYLPQKMTGHNLPHYDTGSQQSGRGDIDHPAALRDVASLSRPGLSTDIYRDSKRQWGKEGPPGSAYNQEYVDYKNSGKAAAQARVVYNKFLKEEPDTEDMSRNKHLYGGKPNQTREWHQEAAQKAKAAAQAFETQSEERREYHHRYIAYHEPSYHDGHIQAAKQASRAAGGHRDEMNEHERWESNDEKNARKKREGLERRSRREGLERGSRREELERGSRREELERGSRREELERGSRREELERGSRREELERGSRREELERRSRR